MKQVLTCDVTKLNKMELIKLKKDGLDILNEIRDFANTGFTAIKSDDLDLLKWAGVYVQKPKSEGYFMMRVKLPGGCLTSKQATVLSKISTDYGRGQIQITSRQAIQLHWIRIEVLPDILDLLSSVGLSSIEACGDCPRTVIGNPLSGIDPDELFDTSSLLTEVAQFFQSNRLFSNLPRKFKISISASPYNAGHAEINDLAFVPAVKTVNDAIIKGFHVFVGGGLSSTPLIAKKLDIFVRPEEVLAVASAVATIFRDYGYREKRFHCRLKFLVSDWGVDKFRDELIKITGSLLTAGDDYRTHWNGGFYYGVNRQKQVGKSYVGLNVPVGQIEATDLDALGRLANSYGDGSLRTTNSQNLIITNISDEKIPELLQETLLQRFTCTPKNFIGHAVSCTGNRYCNLAIVETKERLKAITEYLDDKCDINTPICIHMSGCPNSCGQQQIADISLQGALINRGGKFFEAFELAVGGTLGPKACFAKKLTGRVLAEDTAEIIAQIMHTFKTNRKNSETMHEYIERVGIQDLQSILDTYETITANICP